ncbi:MAG: (d)CMP kinase, partial [Pseudomonadota bacterium]
MTDPKPIVVAIDGPAASGKGTISRRLAARYSLAHLDTGLLYRSVASKALAEGVDPGDERLVEQIADDLTQEDLHRSDLRTIEVAKAASMVAALSGVRRSLLDYQRWFAANPHGGLRGAVLDGRDIGTVICPDATVKLFITASPEERARRRCA